MSELMLNPFDAYVPPDQEEILNQQVVAEGVAGLEFDLLCTSMANDIKEELLSQDNIERLLVDKQDYRFSQDCQELKQAMKRVNRLLVIDPLEAVSQIVMKAVCSAVDEALEAKRLIPTDLHTMFKIDKDYTDDNHQIAVVALLPDKPENT